MHARMHKDQNQYAVILQYQGFKNDEYDGFKPLSEILPKYVA